MLLLIPYLFWIQELCDGPWFTGDESDLFRLRWAGNWSELLVDIAQRFLLLHTLHHLTLNLTVHSSIHKFICPGLGWPTWKVAHWIDLHCSICWGDGLFPHWSPSTISLLIKGFKILYWHVRVMDWVEILGIWIRDQDWHMIESFKMLTHICIVPMMWNCRYVSSTHFSMVIGEIIFQVSVFDNSFMNWIMLESYFMFDPLLSGWDGDSTC